LEVRDREILREQFTGLLKREDFSIPEPIDAGKLVEAIKGAASSEGTIRAEQIKIARWASEQVPKIEAFLQAGALTEAISVCQKVIQRLQDANASASPSVISTLERCNKYCGEQTDKLNRKLRQIDARQFEFEVANLFHKKGYVVSVTSATRDDGVDVFARNKEERVVIQCKRWSRPVGRDKVDELAGVRNRYRANRAILATTSEFSDDANIAAKRSDIELWDFHRLREEWRLALTDP
jgi:HJR/Mrr/RecB family endonuclease